MSHIPVLVVGENWRDQLAPYRDPGDSSPEGGSRQQRTPTWDWYTLGGRWSGFFRLKSEWDDPPVADQARKHEIDWDATWAAARRVGIRACAGLRRSARRAPR